MFHLLFFFGIFISRNFHIYLVFILYLIMVVKEDSEKELDRYLLVSIASSILNPEFYEDR